MRWGEKQAKILPVLCAAAVAEMALKDAHRDMSIRDILGVTAKSFKIFIVFAVLLLLCWARMVSLAFVCQMLGTGDGGWIT